MELSASLTPSSRTAVSYPKKSSSTSPLMPSDDSILSQDAFRKFVEKGQAEVRAAKKIEDAKKELEFLKRAGFPPKVLARLAAELLGRVQKAAGEFESAVGSAGPVPAAAGGAVSDASPTDVTTAVTVGQEDVSLGGDAQTSAANDGKGASSGSVEEKSARGAYQSVLDDATTPADPEEGKLRSQFAALIAELRELVKKAEHAARVEQPGL